MANMVRTIVITPIVKTGKRDFKLICILIFPFRESLAGDICEYYKIIMKLNCASWEDVYIQVVNENASTITENSVTDTLSWMMKLLILMKCGHLYLYLRKESVKYVYRMNHLNRYNRLNWKRLTSH